MFKTLCIDAQVMPAWTAISHLAQVKKLNFKSLRKDGFVVFHQTADDTVIQEVLTSLGEVSYCVCEVLDLDAFGVEYIHVMNDGGTLKVKHNPLFLVSACPDLPD